MINIYCINIWKFKLNLFNSMLSWEFLTVYFDHIHTVSCYSSQIHPTSIYTQLCILLFLSFKYINSTLWCSWILGCGIFHWIVVDLLGAILLKKKILPAIIFVNSSSARSGISWLLPLSMLGLNVAWAWAGLTHAVSIAMSSCVLSKCETITQLVKCLGYK